MLSYMQYRIYKESMAMILQVTHNLEDQTKDETPQQVRDTIYDYTYDDTCTNEAMTMTSPHK